MKLNEQVNRIKSIIYELSPQSSGVQELIDIVKDKPELLKHIGFKSLDILMDFINDASYEDFTDLRDEIDYFLNRRKKYFNDEMDEIQRAVQELTRDEGLNISVSQVLDAFMNASEVTIPKKVWSKLENTESNEFKKGDIGKVIQMAKKYGKSDPSKLKNAIKSGDYKRPLILKFGDRYHLVAGNTRLSTAAAIGVIPQVLIAEI